MTQRGLHFFSKKSFFIAFVLSLYNYCKIIIFIVPKVSPVVIPEGLCQKIYDVMDFPLSQGIKSLSRKIGFQNFIVEISKEIDTLGAVEYLEGGVP